MRLDLTDLIVNDIVDVRGFLHFARARATALGVFVRGPLWERPFFAFSFSRKLAWQPSQFIPTDIMVYGFVIVCRLFERARAIALAAKAYVPPLHPRAWTSPCPPMRDEWTTSFRFAQQLLDGLAQQRLALAQKCALD